MVCPSGRNNETGGIHICLKRLCLFAKKNIKKKGNKENERKKKDKRQERPNLYRSNLAFQKKKKILGSKRCAQNSAHQKRVNKKRIKKK